MSSLFSITIELKVTSDGQFMIQIGGVPEPFSITPGTQTYDRKRSRELAKLLLRVQDEEKLEETKT